MEHSILNAPLILSRKSILCAQARHDHVAAKHIFSEMPDSGRNDRITRYIMYKTGLLTEDSELGNTLSPIIVGIALNVVVTECLDIVCRHAGNDATLLYACIVEAQASGKNTHVIATLEKMLDKYDHNAPSGVHLPALLR